MASKMTSLWYFHFVLLCWLSSSSCAANDNVKKEASRVPGHRKPLGSHRPGEGVTVTGKFSSPVVFYIEFVSKGEPLWMSNVLENIDHFGLKNWTDQYFRDLYGDVSVNIETSKKEDRQKNAKSLTLRQFLNLYKEENFYMVHSLRSSLEDLVLVPPSLSCGGFQKLIQDAVMWLGSGKTSSVLHYDMLDNLLCLFDGQKELILIDPKYKDDVEADGFVQNGGYSLVDVDSVDMDKFPRLANIHWKIVSLRRGDCVFIPKGWYHQVTSSTTRHLAINYWFSRLYWLNETDCPILDVPASQPLKPISAFGFASPNEVLRSRLLEKLDDKGIMIKYNFIDSLDSSTEERREKFFTAVDKYKDHALSWSELYDFDIDKAVQHFPDIFDLPGATDSADDIILYDPIVYSQDTEHSDIEDDSDIDDIDVDDEEGEKENSKLSEESVSKEQELDLESELPSPDDVSEDGARTKDNSAHVSVVDEDVKLSADEEYENDVANDHSNTRQRGKDEL